MGDVGVQLVFGLIFGAACAAIANNKGRSAVGWFFGGFFLGCIGLIIILCLSDEKAAERRRSKASGDRRRLREQLNQERMKTEAYRRHVTARLDAHDSHAGIDTRSAAGLPEGHGMQHGAARLGEGTGVAQGFAGAAAAQPGVGHPGVGQPAAAPGSTVKEWFYERGGESRGPVSEAAIRMGLGNGKIDGTTLVWREGMANWQAISEVQPFSSDFRA